MAERNRQPDQALTDAKRAPAPPRSGPRWFLVKVCLPLIVLISGATGAFYVYNSKPEAKRRKPQDPATLVRVMPVVRSTQNVVVRAMGTAIAAQEVILQPQVSGQITKLSPEFIPGGRVGTGDVLASIDPADYRTALDRAEAELAGRQAELQSATWELARLEGLESKNAVNKKEMDDGRTAKAIASANVAAARAAVEQAQLDLARTTIRAPFNGIITEKSVDLGALVSPQTQLATLVGTDEYWIEASVPVDRLDWISIPDASDQQGSRATIYRVPESTPQSRWTGRVLRLLGNLEQQGRMARVLIAVKDPLGLASRDQATAPLLIGAYLRVEIEGTELDDVFAIPRSALKEDDRVWIMDEDGSLVTKEVAVAWRDRYTVLVRGGLRKGERLVISDIATPVVGMKLCTTPSEQKVLVNGRDPHDARDTNP